MTNKLISSPLTGEQQQQLDRLLAGLANDQLYWLAGYLAGYCAVPGQAGSPGAGASISDRQGSAELTILFGSQTGNAEGVAGQLAARAAAKGVVTRMVDLADYKPKQLRQEQFLALVTSTQGEGEPPDNALDFHEFLMGKKAPKVTQLRYSVLGLGDSSYEHFCQTARDFDERLGQLGASTLAGRVDCDVDYEDPAEQWIERVLEAMIAAAGVSAPAQSATTPQAPAEVTYHRKNPYLATILTNQVLNGRGSDKEVRHIELSLEDSGLEYKPGDALAVCPENPPGLVAELLSALGFDAGTTVDIDHEPVALGDALARHREITLLTPPLVRQWAELANHEELSALADNNAELRSWMGGRDLLDLVRRWPVPSLAPQQLITMLRKLPPRLYSISSSQAAEEDEVHITVAAVRYHSHGRDREGVASVWLADRLAEGQQVPVYIDTNKNFALPDDDSRPLIMIGPGTGVAPFRAFLQEREERGAEGDNWLVFGDRHFRSDFLYQSEWLRWRRDGLLTRLDVAFSRDQAEKRYVQHCLQENGAQLWDWLERGACLYVCGDAERMAPDVHRALQAIICQHSGRTEEQAEDYLRQLNRDKRYQRDVY